MTVNQPVILWTNRGYEIVCSDCHSGEDVSLTPSVAAKQLEDAQRDRDAAEECAYCGCRFRAERGDLP